MKSLRQGRTQPHPVACATGKKGLTLEGGGTTLASAHRTDQTQRNGQTFEPRVSPTLGSLFCHRLRYQTILKKGNGFRLRPLDVGVDLYLNTISAV